MSEGILVPLVGTRFAEAALPAALQLARTLDLSLGLVTVWEPMLPAFDTSVAELERDEHAARHRYMKETALRLEELLGTAVSVKYLRGRPSEELPPLAEPNGLKIVVMATHGRGPIKRASLGSVADQVVRKGNAPVLLIRPQEEPVDVAFAAAAPFRRILIPLDGSDLAETALQRSLLLKTGEPIELTLLRVVTFPQRMVAGGGGSPAMLDDEIVSAETAAAQRYLDGVAKRLVGWGCNVVTRVRHDASSWGGIVDFAASNAVDLIAMATHGRGGAKRLLLGSVADKVIRTSTVPVLLFHPERAPSPWQDVERIAGQVAGMP